MGAEKKKGEAIIALELCHPAGARARVCGISSAHVASLGGKRSISRNVSTGRT